LAHRDCLLSTQTTPSFLYNIICTLGHFADVEIAKLISTSKYASLSVHQAATHCEPIDEILANQVETFVFRIVLYQREGLKHLGQEYLRSIHIDCHDRRAQEITNCSRN
jgi:hypothetical protein